MRVIDASMKVYLPVIYRVSDPSTVIDEGKGLINVSMCDAPTKYRGR